MIRAVAAGITPALRTERSAGYKGVTLRDVAGTIAGRHGLTVTGDIDAIKFDRITQHEERDLAFLKRLAENHGYVFHGPWRSARLHQIAALQAGPVALEIAPAVLISWRITDKAHEVYKGATVSYHDPATKSLMMPRS